MEIFKKLTEASVTQVLNHAYNEGIIIISTSRSVVVPINDDGIYDYDSWQSLFDDYVNYCNLNNLDIFEGSMSVQKGKRVNALLNTESSKKFLDKRNKDCDQELWKYLRSSENPYNFTPSLGGYSSATEKTSKEPSFMIYNSFNQYKTGKIGPDDFNNLIKNAIYWCKKYKQDCVYIQAPGEAPKYIDKDGNTVSTSSSLKVYSPNGKTITRFNKETGKWEEIPNEKGDFFTSVKRKVKHSRPNMSKEELLNDEGILTKSFKADISFAEGVIGNMYDRSHICGSLVERNKYSQLGEIKLNEN